VDIPLYIFLLLYVGLVLTVFLFSFFAIYHARRFGMRMAAVSSMTVIYLIGVGVILMVTFIAASAVDWSETLTISIPGVTTGTPTPTNIPGF